MSRRITGGLLLAGLALAGSLACERREEAPAEAPPAAAPPAAPAPGEPPAALEQDLQDDFMAVDRANRKVSYAVIAAYNSVNGGWNFNGYADGDMRMVVPLGWTVEVFFEQRDPSVPHSAGVIDADPKALPVSGENVTMPFPRAKTLDFVRGLSAGQTDQFSFTVDKAGKFILFCGVPTHGQAGMWDWFEVSTSARMPEIHLGAGT